MTRRVLFFVETPHRLAGAQKALLAMLEPIRRYGIEPLVVFPGEGIAVDAFRAAGLDVRVEEAPESLMVFERGLLRLSTAQKLTLGLRAVLPYSAKISLLARREGIEVAHFNQLRGILLAGLGLAALGIPRVLHVHGMPNFGSRALLRVGAGLATRLVLCADAIRPALDPLFRAKATTVHNGLATPQVPGRAVARDALAEALGLSPRELDGVDVMLTLSTRTAFKGLHHLAVAVAGLRCRDRRVIWAMLGPDAEPTYARYLDARLHELGLDDGTVRVLGFRRDAVSLLAGADVLVLPTVEREVLDDGTGPREVLLTEGLPMSILEALSVGVPVVATDVAGVREQLDDGVTGLVVPPSDAAALELAIARILEDRDLRERVRILGPEVVRERFSIDRASRALARVLLAV